MYIRKVLLTVLLLFPSFCFAGYQTATFNATADVYIVSSLPNNNFGYPEYVVFGDMKYYNNYYYAFLKYDISSIGHTSVISASTTLIHHTTLADSCNTTINAVAMSTSTSSWGETTITWNNKPTTTDIADVSDSLTKRVCVGTVQQPNITLTITSIAKASNIVSVALRTDANGSNTGYFSKEYGNNIPYIKLTYNRQPSISSKATNSPVSYGSNIRFNTTFTDADNTGTYTAKICKTNSLTGTLCTGGQWASATAPCNSGATTASATYTTSIGDVGTQNYYTFICDDSTAGNACSASSSGSFTVNNQCSDGTLLNQCSGQRLCTDSGLQYVCGRCDYQCCGSTPLTQCNGDYYCASQGFIHECGKCNFSGCIGTQYCSGNTLVNDCRYCGYTCATGNSCSPTGTCYASCSDAAATNTCYNQKPFYCNPNGTQIENCSICGCATGYSCLNNGSCIIFNFSTSTSQVTNSTVGGEDIVFETTVNGTGEGECIVSLPDNSVTESISRAATYTKENNNLKWQCNLTNSPQQVVRYNLPAPNYKNLSEWKQEVQEINVGQKEIFKKQLTIENLNNVSIINISLAPTCEFGNCTVPIIAILSEKEEKQVNITSEVEAVSSKTASYFDNQRNGFWFVDNWTNNMDFNVYNVTRTYVIDDCIPSTIEVVIDGLNVTANTSIISTNECNVTVLYPQLTPKQLLDPDIFYKTTDMESTPTPTVSVSPTPSSTPSATPSPTVSPSPTPSPTATSSATPIPSPTFVSSTPTAPTPIPTERPWWDIFSTSTPTPEPTFEATPLATPVSTVTPEGFEIKLKEEAKVGVQLSFEITENGTNVSGNAKFISPDGNIFYRPVENGNVTAVFDKPGEWIVSFKNQVSMKFLVSGESLEGETQSNNTVDVRPDTMMALAAASQNNSFLTIPIILIITIFVAYNFLMSPKIVFKKKKGKDVVIVIKNKLKKPLQNIEVRDLTKGKTNSATDKKQTIFGDMLTWKRDSLMPNDEWTISYSSDATENGVAEFSADCDGKRLTGTS